MNLSGFIEKYGTQPAQELLDFIFIKQCIVKSRDDARNMLIRWKAVKKTTKYVYNYSWIADSRIRIRFRNGRNDYILSFDTTLAEIESLRASIYADRGETNAEGNQA